MRTLARLAAALAATAALSACGFRTEDPELEEALAWARDFKAEQPELSRALAQECDKESGRSAYTRDGALALFTCVRAKYEARG